MPASYIRGTIVDVVGVVSVLKPASKVLKTVKDSLSQQHSTTGHLARDMTMKAPSK